MASQQQWNRGLIGSGAALGVWALLVAVLGFGLAATTTPNSDAVPNPSVTATPSPTATATGTPTATCDPKFVQEKANYGPDNRVDGNFEKEYADTVANKSGADKENAQRELILKHSANNAQRLAIWAHANGLYATPNDWQKLVAGNCLSKEGQDLWNQLRGALSSGGTTFGEADAPPNGYNTGVTPDGTYVVAENPGIVGNPKAIVITYKDGTQVYILIYCGNVVFPAPPAHVPTSPVIPQPPKSCPPGMTGTPPNCETPPVPVCPPGTTGTPPKCLEWKNPAQGSFQQGNAPTGGGNNDTSGPGEYIAPPAMQQPPAVQPAPPAPPAPQPAPVGNEPAPNPNPEGPRPTAPPEPAAPAPSEAVDSCVPAPGKTTC